MSVGQKNNVVPLQMGDRPGPLLGVSLSHGKDITKQSVNVNISENE